MRPTKKRNLELQSVNASMSEVTAMLTNHPGGDAAALERLVPLVYEELHRMARNYLRHERNGHTLQATALINEAYLRLHSQRESQWQNRAHFLAISAQMMRRILLDHARQRQAKRRGGAEQKLSLDEALVVSKERSAELIALDEALDRLSTIDPQQAHIVVLHFFGGLTMKEIAEVLGCEQNLVQQEWRMAKAWLHCAVSS
jgi:RNA polymerase sigma-70 factor, ECF subfamily